MRSISEVYEQISARDADMLEKQAGVLAKQAEIDKQAEEEEYAGRIMARGFAAELHKLAESDVAKPIGNFGGTVKSAPFGGAPSAMTGGGPAMRTSTAPPKPALAAGHFGRGQGGYGSSNLNMASGTLGGQPGAVKPKAPPKPPGQGQ